VIYKINENARAFSLLRKAKKGKQNNLFHAMSSENIKMPLSTDKNRKMMDLGVM